MSTLTEYFEKTAYKPKYLIGDRIFGYWNKIPFIGTVGNDRTKVGSDPNPEVIVHTDLPIVFNNIEYSVIIVKHRDIKLLTKID